MIGRQQWIVTLNLDVYRQLKQRRNIALVSVINEKAAVCLDGFPLVVASRFLGNRNQERITGADLVFDIAQYCEKLNIPVVIIGGNRNVSTKASEKLNMLFRKLKVIPIEIPLLGVDKIQERLVEELGGYDRAFLFVGFGALKSEYVISKLLVKLPGVCFIGCGGALSFISGDHTRCPEALQSIGLEWAWRLIQEPKRLYKRYIFQGIPAMVLLILQSVMTRIIKLNPRKSPE